MTDFGLANTTLIFNQRTRSVDLDRLIAATNLRVRYEQQVEVDILSECACTPQLQRDIPGNYRIIAENTILEYVAALNKKDIFLLSIGCGMLKQELVITHKLLAAGFNVHWTLVDCDPLDSIKKEKQHLTPDHLYASFVAVLKELMSYYPGRIATLAPLDHKTVAGLIAQQMLTQNPLESESNIRQKLFLINSGDRTSEKTDIMTTEILDISRVMMNTRLRTNYGFTIPDMVLAIDVLALTKPGFPRFYQQIQALICNIQAPLLHVYKEQSGKSQVKMELITMPRVKLAAEKKSVQLCKS